MRTRFEIEAQGHSEIEFLIILILVVVNPKYRSYTQGNPSIPQTILETFNPLTLAFFTICNREKLNTS